jgi:hypothetical protein
MITLTIYKDLTGLKYQKILNSVNTGIKVQPKSFFHNTKMIRKILIGWAKQQIVNEGKDSWNDQKKLFLKKKRLEKVNLMIDSPDFQLSREASTSRKDSKWNYKQNRLGQQFQVICDARGKVQKVWSGYNPKIYNEY